MATENDCPAEDIDALRAVSAVGVKGVSGTSSTCPQGIAEGRDFAGIERRGS